MWRNFHHFPHLRLVTKFLAFDYIHNSLCLIIFTIICGWITSQFPVFHHIQNYLYLIVFTITLRDFSYRMFSQVPWVYSASHQGVLEYHILTLINLVYFKKENIFYLHKCDVLFDIHILVALVMFKMFIKVFYWSGDEVEYLN